MAKKKKKAVRTVRRKPAKRKKKSARKRAPVKRKRATKRKPTRKRKAVGKRVVKQVEKRSVERVMAGRRYRRRSVGSNGIGGKGLLIGLGIGALALYFLTKQGSTTTTPGGTFTLPPLNQTSNYTRNTQSNDLINYAIAGGLAIDAIIKLIDRLNNSSDQEVDNIYDRVNTTGDFSTYV